MKKSCWMKCEECFAITNNDSSYLHCPYCGAEGICHEDISKGTALKVTLIHVPEHRLPRVDTKIWNRMIRTLKREKREWYN